MKYKKFLHHNFTTGQLKVEDICEGYGNYLTTYK
jgi:hypothetical protein